MGDFIMRMSAALSLLVLTTLPSAAQTVEIYSAGSAGNMIRALSKEPGLAGIEIKLTASPAGGLRDRILAGEKPDLFLSADMASPHKLEAAGRTVMPVLAYAQNHMCLTVRSSLGVTQNNIAERMLAKGTRIKTNEPIVDPGGDFAYAIFDRIDVLHKGAGQILRDKAESVAEATKSAQVLPGHSAAASQFIANQIDMVIGYCSVASALPKELPDVTVVQFPPALDPDPVYGMAVLSAKPEALRVALFLLSERGQAIVKDAGLIPLLSPSR
jgi:molybdate transport system substrate-binding protein